MRMSQPILGIPTTITPQTDGLSAADAAFVEMMAQRAETAIENKTKLIASENDFSRLRSLGFDPKVLFPEALMAKKPSSTLADDLIFSEDKQAIVDKKTEAMVRAKVRSAKRFVLTEEAAIKVGEAIRAYPEMLVEQGVFARTPFETCWIEMPSYRFHETIVPGSSTPEADTRVGYLFDGDNVYIVAQRDETVASISPLVIHLHQTHTLKQELKLTEELNLSRYSLDYFYWGKTMADELPVAIRRGLREQHSFSMHTKEKYKSAITGEEFLMFSAGEVRNIIGLLLMINQPSSILRAEPVEKRRAMTRKGSRLFMAHSVITLHLDKRHRPDRIFRLPRAFRMGPKWHEVMNHWCHDKIARTKGHNEDDPRTHGRGNHAHVWEQDDDGVLRFTCSICGGKRWRRIMKGRGNKSRGTVTQERIVKAGAERHNT